MVRRTVTLPEGLDSRVREVAGEGESFSAAVTRLIEAGLASDRGRLSWIGSGDSGDPDLALRVGDVLEELVADAAND